MKIINKITIDNKSKILVVILITLIVWSITTSFVFFINKIYFITFDQGRDLIWSYNQILFHKPSLIGPWGSISGIFFGPLWFWILGIVLFFSGGNPISTVLVNMFIVYLGGLLLYLILKKINKTASLIAPTLYFASPYVQSMAGFAFSQHLLPILSMGFIYYLIEYLDKQKIQNLFILSVFVGLMFHSEPPTAIYSLLALVLILIINYHKNIKLLGKEIITIFLALLLTLLPLLFFELRHDFIQSKSLISYFTGDNKSYSDVGPLLARILDRPNNLIYLFLNVLIPKANLWIGMIVILYISLKFKMKKSSLIIQKYIKISLYYIISFFLFISILPVEYKAFYLDGIVILLIMIFSLAISVITEEIYVKKWIGIYLVYLILLLKPWDFLNSLSTDFKGFKLNPSVYANQTKVIDWIYQKANGEGFVMYSYVPQVYDYAYQYLVGWKGLKDFKYLPKEYSYLPNKVGYVQMKEEFIQKNIDKVKETKGLTFLVLETGEQISYSKSYWLNHFSNTNYTFIDQVVFEDGTEVRMLMKTN